MPWFGRLARAWCSHCRSDCASHLSACASDFAGRRQVTQSIVISEFDVDKFPVNTIFSHLQVGDGQVTPLVSNSEFDADYSCFSDLAEQSRVELWAFWAQPCLSCSLGTKISLTQVKGSEWAPFLDVIASEVSR